MDAYAYSSAANASKMSKISNMFSLPVPGVEGVPGASGGAIGGMPCKFQLIMEFVCSFLFTFIIYFCVFAFFPYDGIIKKILEFIQNTTKKFMDFINLYKNFIIHIYISIFKV